MFITFEGPEGGGKTSQMRQAAEFLREMHVELILTREPGGTEIGNQIRAILNGMENTAMQPRTEILLFLAARAQVVEECIRPNLAQNKVVLCDRYADSTLAYQGYGHGMDLDALRYLLRFTTSNLWPDLTFFLDIDVKKGLQRKIDSKEWNRMDAYNLAFHQRVYAGYKTLIQESPQRWVRIDADQPFDAVQSDIRRELLQRLHLGSL